MPLSPTGGRIAEGQVKGLWGAGSAPTKNPPAPSPSKGQGSRGVAPKTALAQMRALIKSISLGANPSKGRLKQSSPNSP